MMMFSSDMGDFSLTNFCVFDCRADIKHNNHNKIFLKKGGGRHEKNNQSSVFSDCGLRAFKGQICRKIFVVVVLTWNK